MRSGSTAAWSSASWKSLLGIGGETPLETCLAEARKAGFEGMELGNKFPREPAAVKEALAPLVVLTIFFGAYPAPILDIFGASVETLIKPLQQAAAAAEALATASLQ